MKIESGDFTVGDVDVSITITVNEVLTGMTIRFIFIKPSGNTLSVVATSISTYTATYTWVSGDLDEAGTWRVSLKNMDRPNEYKPQAQAFRVSAKTEEMAVA